MSYIVLAIPVSFLLIAVELVVTWIQEKDYYWFHRKSHEERGTRCASYGSLCRAVRRWNSGSSRMQARSGSRAVHSGLA